jgi:putative ABC transport system substrate-binding protein
MRRRELVILLGAALLRAPVGHAQQPGRTYRLGLITPFSRGSIRYVQFFGELAHQGFVEGKNLRVDPRGFNTPIDRFYAVAVEMVHGGVDAIACAGGAWGSAALQRATRTVPLVVVSDDFLKDKLVTSLAHPGGNITGVSIFATELDGKRQQLLLELVPGARHIAALADPRTTPPSELEALQKAARAKGVALTIVRARRRAEIAGAIAAAKRSGAEALNVLASLMFYTNRKLIHEEAAKADLPAIYQWPDDAEEGGFAGYGPSHASIQRMWARVVAQVLRGAKPAQLPVEQPDRFEFVINLKTAKALGLKVPPSILARADEVIR